MMRLDTSIIQRTANNNRTTKMSACKTCGRTATIDNGEACAHCGCDRELSEPPGSAFLVQKLGRLLQMPEREWTEKDILEACRDLVARYKHTMARCQDAAQKYRLGLGGEPVDRLVLDELHRLKKARPSAQGE